VALALPFVAIVWSTVSAAKTFDFVSDTTSTLGLGLGASAIAHRIPDLPVLFHVYIDCDLLTSVFIVLSY
jgi:hypothetical protein